MDGTSDIAAERFREQIRARAKARSRAGAQRAPAGVRAGAIAAAVLLHLIAAIGLYLLMRPRPTADRDRIEVRLLGAPPSELPLPEPPPAPTRAASVPSATRRVVDFPVPHRMPPQADAAPEEEAALHLFNADGSVAVPPESAKSPRGPESKNAFVSSIATSPSLPEIRRPVKLRPNRFAGAWRAPANENLLGTALRKTAELVDEKLTVRKEFKTPWGSKVKCQASYMVVMARAGCGWGIAPKPYEPEERWQPATVLDEK